MWTNKSRTVRGRCVCLLIIKGMCCWMVGPQGVVRTAVYYPRQSSRSSSFCLAISLALIDTRKRANWCRLYSQSTPTGLSSLCFRLIGTLSVGVARVCLSMNWFRPEVGKVPKSSSHLLSLSHFILCSHFHIRARAFTKHLAITLRSHP